MISRDDCYEVFKRCDQDNDGLIWISQLKELAVNHVPSNSNTSFDFDVEEDEPLDFEKFYEWFSGQCEHGIDEIPSLDPKHVERKLSELDFYDSDTDMNTTGSELKKTDTATDSGRFSGQSECFLDEEGFEGFGEAESDLLESDFQCLENEVTVLSPVGSFRRKNSPFRQSQRRKRLEESSSGGVTASPTNTTTTATSPVSLEHEEQLEKIQMLEHQLHTQEDKMSQLEQELHVERDISSRMQLEKRDAVEKLLTLEETLRDVEYSFSQKEKQHLETISHLTEKIECLKDSHEIEKSTWNKQQKSFESSIKEVEKEKTLFSEEISKLRDAWSISQEKEAMWETKYEESLQSLLALEEERGELVQKYEEEIMKHKTENTELLHRVKELEEAVLELEDQTRQRSETVLGCLQGKVEEYQQENAQLKEMTATILSRNEKHHETLALELGTATNDEITEAFNTLQRDYGQLQRYVDKLLTNIIAQAPHLLCVDNSK